ncbi:hypothetical protein TWF506_008209 [Arthrobotrys conoides]|uniref:Microbial-type PARG catalytic domain-containing protein n=1 Tax=Arthrobotrys conoides TaxID=74498 RepID=A0AAN8NMX9_9PEZI
MNPSESPNPRLSHRGGRGGSNHRGSNRARGHHTSPNTSSQSNTPNATSSPSSSRGDHHNNGHRGRGNGRNRYMSPAKAERARAARETINTTIPHILTHTPRAKAGVLSAQKHVYSEIPSVPKSINNTYIPQISVVYSDTFDAAQDLILRLKSQYPKDYETGKIRVGVLNMASNTNPGGGVLNGSQAQEETLCRRSTLYPSLLTSHFHPLPAGSAIFTSDVLVFMTQSYEMLKVEDRFYVDVISMAAPKRPELTADKKRYADQASYEELVMGVKGMMRLAQNKGITHFVAGAFGCGAYGNPNALVAECFKRVICGRGFGSEGWEREEREVWSGVREVVFAIYGEDRGKGNLEAFREAFREVGEWRERHVDGEGEMVGGGHGGGEDVGEASGSGAMSTV